MRADRLVAILLLLQKNGRTTARALAEELEVSERTIYRDIDALSASGIPLYAQSGPGGGIELLDSYRTDLTGMTTAELHSLLALSVPAPLQSLGLGGDLSSALRKLAAAVPVSRRSPDRKLREKIYIDDSEWSGSGTGGSIFETIRKSLWEDIALRVTYFSELGSYAGTITAELNPLGLVASAGEWFLVAERGRHRIAFPIAAILTVNVTGVNFQRPEDFQLDEFWRTRRALRSRHRLAFNCDVIIAESAVPFLGNVLMEELGRADASHVLARLHFNTFEDARAAILALGIAAEVAAPLALRLSVADFARQTAAIYDSV